MDELAIYNNQGFGNSSGFGERPALLMVDFVNGFCDPDCFGGGNILSAVEQTSVLLKSARELNLPIVHTRIVYENDGADNGVFCKKVPSLERLTETASISQIVNPLKPLKGEHVIRKTQPSAFFGTGLAAWLIGRNVSTVIVTGCTTSGCVRASVVDSMSYNFKTIVVSDCVGDRALGPHEANLFDIGQKYADLHTCAETIKAIKKLNQNTYHSISGDIGYT
jgi:maleamate amidohydrolase